MKLKAELNGLDEVKRRDRIAAILRQFAVSEASDILAMFIDQIRESAVETVLKRTSTQFDLAIERGRVSACEELIQRMMLMDQVARRRRELNDERSGLDLLNSAKWRHGTQSPGLV